MARRRVTAVLNVEMIAQMLDLPEGFYVVGVEGRLDPPSLLVAVESAQLPEATPNAEAPRRWPDREYIDGAWVTNWHWEG